MTKEGAESLVRAYAIETQSFVLPSTGILSQDGLEKMQLKGHPIFGYGGGGCAAVFGPDGRKLSEDLGPHEEGLVVVDLDLSAILAVKSWIDVVGHYSLMGLVTDSREKKPVEPTPSS